MVVGNTLGGEWNYHSGPAKFCTNWDCRADELDEMCIVDVVPVAQVVHPHQLFCFPSASPLMLNRPDHSSLMKLATRSLSLHLFDVLIQLVEVLTLGFELLF